MNERMDESGYGGMKNATYFDSYFHCPTYQNGGQVS